MARFKLNIKQEMESLRQGNISYFQMITLIQRMLRNFQGWMPNARTKESLDRLVDDFGSFGADVGEKEFGEAMAKLEKWASMKIPFRLKTEKLCSIKSIGRRDAPVPGVDDYDILLTASTRNGRDSLYLRLIEIGHDGSFQGTLTTNFDSTHDCHDVGKEQEFKNIRAAANHLRRNARKIFGWRRFVLCSTSREALVGSAAIPKLIAKEFLDKKLMRSSSVIKLSPHEVKSILNRLNSDRNRIDRLEKIIMKNDLCMDCGEPVESGCGCQDETGEEEANG